VSRVQLPIIVTLNKLLSVDDTGDQGDAFLEGAFLEDAVTGVPTLQAISGATVAVWNAGVAPEVLMPVYEGPTPKTTRDRRGTHAYQRAGKIRRMGRQI
jgi:hypothetical protein